MTGREVEVMASEKQVEALELLLSDQVQYLCFGGGAGGGKTMLSCLWLLTNCYRYPDTRWFIGREELKRLRESWDISFHKLLSSLHIPRSDYNFNGQYSFYQFYNGSRIDMLDLKYYPGDPLYERFGSVEYTGGAIEEGGEVDFRAFDVLKTRVGRYNNEKYGLIPAKVLITCNPKKNWIYRYFYKPWKESRLAKGYAFVPALAHENPFLDNGYLENLDSIADQITKQRLKYGVWEYDEDKSALIPYDKIQDLFRNEHVKGGASALTCDIARFGKDHSVIIRWDGFIAVDFVELNKSSVSATATEIRRLATSYHIPMSRVIADEEGVGGGVVDILGCRGFVAGSRAVEVAGKKTNYANLKAQCSFLFSERANAAGYWLKVQSPAMCQVITEELEQIKSETVDNDTKLSIIKKEIVKDMIGRSPDYSDALVMREALELPYAAKIKSWSIS